MTDERLSLGSKMKRIKRETLSLFIPYHFAHKNLIRAWNNLAQLARFIGVG